MEKIEIKIYIDETEENELIDEVFSSIDCQPFLEKLNISVVNGSRRSVILSRDCCDTVVKTCTNLQKIILSKSQNRINIKYSNWYEDSPIILSICVTP